MNIPLRRIWLYLGLWCASAVVSAYAQDIPGDPTTTVSIASGESVPSAFENRSDHDWFRVNLVGGFTYAWELHGATDAGGTTTTRGVIVLRDRDGLEMSTHRSSTAGGARREEFNATISGTYFVDVQIFGGTEGTYTLVMSPADAIGNRGDLALPLEVAETLDSRLESEIDSDWLSSSFERGLTYAWTMLDSSSGIGDVSNPYLELYDARSNLLASARSGSGPNRAAQLVYTAPLDQDAFVAASTLTQRSRNFGDYRLIASNQDKYVTGPSTQAVVSPFDTVESELVAPGDADWFRIDVQAGRTYLFDLLGSSTASGTLERPKLEVRALDGTILEDDQGGGTGFNARVSHTAESDGTWYVVAMGATTRYMGTYVLSVGPQDDYPADTSTLGRVAPGFSATGTLEAPDDQDWFRFFAEGGKVYEIFYDEARSGVGTIEYPWARVFTGDGAVVASSTWTSFEFRAPVTGVYYLSAGSRFDDFGTYRLRVSNPDEPASPTAALAASVLPSSRSVRVGETAAFFASIINAGPETARACGIVSDVAIPAALEFRASDPVTNQQLAINERVKIPPGKVANFFLTFRPGVPFDATEINFAFDCLNSDAAAVLSGVNTFVLASTEGPTPDTILNALTVSGDGIIRLPSANGSGSFAVAGSNVGVAGDIHFHAIPIGAPTNVLICETNPSNGFCLGSPAPAVRRMVAAGEQFSFAVFVQGVGVPIALNPAEFRVQVKAVNPSDPTILYGSTSVAVTTQ